MNSVERILTKVSSLIVAYPRRTVVIGLGIALASLVPISSLEVVGGHSELSDPKDPHSIRFRNFLQNFGSPNLLFAMIEGGDAATRRLVSSRLAEELPSKRMVNESEASRHLCKGGTPNATDCVRDVTIRVDYSRLASFGLLYLKPVQLQRIYDHLTALTRERGADLETLRSRPSLGGLFSFLSRWLEWMSHQDESYQGRSTAIDPNEKAPSPLDSFSSVIEAIDRSLRQQTENTVLIRAVENAGRRLGLSGGRESAGLDSDGYFVSKDGEFLIALIRPSDESDDPASVVPFVSYVERQSDRIVKEVSSAQQAGSKAWSAPLRIRIGGMPALVAAEKRALARDLPLTTFLAIGGIAGLFIFGFRSFRHSLVGLVPLVVALAVTLALVRFTVGSLNMLSAAFVPTLLGLGIDFSVHLLSRYNEARRSGSTTGAAVRFAIIHSGPGMLTGALTTAVAFAALGVCDFRAFAHLGWISAVGLIVALVATLTVGSALLMLPWLAQPVADRNPKAISRSIIAFGDRAMKRHRILLAGSAIVTIVMVWQGRDIPWSYDYLELLPRESSAVAVMADLVEHTSFSGEVAAMVVDSPEAAKRASVRLREKSSVGRVESLADFLPQKQQEKLMTIRKIRELLRKKEVRESSRDKVNEKGSPSAHAGLTELLEVVEDLHFSAAGAGRAEATDLKRLIIPLRRLSKTMASLPHLDGGVRRLDRMEKLVTNQLQGFFQWFERSTETAVLDISALLDRLPRGVVDRLYHRGKLALYIYPRGSVWKNGLLDTFVHELRSIDPEVTGFPVTYFETIAQVNRGFRLASALALCGLIVLLFVDFRSLAYVAFSLVTLAVGALWMWGGMSLVGLKYNFASIVAFPLIIGIGVASAVHILHRFRQEGERDIVPVVRHTGIAVFLSAATTMVGFGSLSFASHRGAASLGKTLLIGVVACLVASTVVLPSLLQCFIKEDDGKNKSGS